VLVKAVAGPFWGIGEASLPPYHGETEDSVLGFIDMVAREGIDLDEGIAAVMRKVDALSVADNAAKAAIDIALHDLLGQMKGMSIGEMLDVPQRPEPPSSMTIALGDLAALPQKIEEARDFKVIKLKLGGVDDLRLLSDVKALTDKAIYADANQAWADRGQALEMAQELHRSGFAMLEQPMPRTSAMADMEWLAGRSPLPIYADEAVKRLTDLEWARHCFHGINIKLMKCTGLTEARAMIGQCRELGLGVMLGCMTETSCASMAMAHLAPLADHVDLDGPFLISNNPFIDPVLNDGRVMPGPGNGIGLSMPEGRAWPI
jgi:L-alanine-DL-glutamate epimerase-like enolase superfamily enzyme